MAVIGGGSTALQDAEFLSNYCRKVYLVHRRDEFRGEESIVRRLREKENVEFVLSATVKEIVGDTTVEGIILNDKKNGQDSALTWRVCLLLSDRYLRMRYLRIR